MGKVFVDGGHLNKTASALPDPTLMHAVLTCVCLAAPCLAAGVVFVAATNRADLLDPALMRAGRFDRKIRILRPNEQGRTEILRVCPANWLVD